MEIIWKEIKDYPNYKINNLGEIYGYYRNKNMKLIPREDGYIRVMLYNNEGNKRFYVHVLVATAFLDNPNNLPEVDHKDCDRANNCVDNLKWVTRKENLDRCFELKHHKNNPRKIKAINIDTLQELEFESTREASRQLDIKNSKISDILHGRRKTIHKWTFQYI